MRFDAFQDIVSVALTVCLLVGAIFAAIRWLRNPLKEINSNINRVEGKLDNHIKNDEARFDKIEATQVKIRAELSEDHGGSIKDIVLESRRGILVLTARFQDHLSVHKYLPTAGEGDDHERVR